MSLAVVRQILSERVGACFVNLVSETEPSLTGGKSCPIKGRVKKISRFNGQVNWNYENAVNNRRAKESKPLDAVGNVELFEAEARAWGQRLHAELATGNRLLPFVYHKAGTKKGSVPSHTRVTFAELQAMPDEELYLEMRVLDTLEHYYVLDGKRLTAEEAKEIVHPWLPERKEGARQAVDNPVILRDYKMSSLLQITIDGVVHTIR